MSWASPCPIWRAFSFRGGVQWRPALLSRSSRPRGRSPTAPPPPTCRRNVSRSNGQNPDQTRRPSPACAARNRSGLDSPPWRRASGQRVRRCGLGRVCGLCAPIDFAAATARCASVVLRADDRRSRTPATTMTPCRSWDMRPARPPVFQSGMWVGEPCDCGLSDPAREEASSSSCLRRPITKAWIRRRWSSFRLRSLWKRARSPFRADMTPA